MKSILDPSFQYTPAAQTDLQRTFARLRNAEAGEREYDSWGFPPASTNVQPLRKEKRT